MASPVIYRALRLGVLIPPPPADLPARPKFPATPVSSSWRAIVETAVPTVAPAAEPGR